MTLSFILQLQCSYKLQASSFRWIEAWSLEGSAGELRSQVYVGMTIGYIDNNAGTRWLREAERISRMLHSLIRTARQER